LNFFTKSADIDVNRRLLRGKIGGCRQMGLLMLRFDRMIGFAPINVLAVYANAHGLFLLDALGAMSYLLQLLGANQHPFIVPLSLGQSALNWAYNQIRR
jgi:hypothetical protein